ncbi:MAG: hypothetical protein WD267_08105 [Balneolales bacterium]
MDLRAFGEDSDGPIRSFEEVAFTWLAFDMVYTTISSAYLIDLLERK